MEHSYETIFTLISSTIYQWVEGIAKHMSDLICENLWTTLSKEEAYLVLSQVNKVVSIIPAAMEAVVHEYDMYMYHH